MSLLHDVLKSKRESVLHELQGALSYVRNHRHDIERSYEQLFYHKAKADKAEATIREIDEALNPPSCHIGAEV